MNRTLKKCFIALLLSLCQIATTEAQVTIGSGEVPNNGSLLDLKEKNTTDGSANSKRGLALPRVKLTTMNPIVGKLAESIGSTGNWDELAHTGLLVYNVENTLDACTGGAYPGVYSWDGNKWLALYAKQTAPPSTEITTDLFEGANSYLAKTNSLLSIPVKRAFDIWTAYAGNDPGTGKVLNLGDVNNLSGALSAAIIWQETGTVSSVAISGTGNTATLNVSTGANAGNALVNVTIGGKVLWQWHIWVTNTNPLENAHAYIVNGKTDWYMDRFLGADAASSAGLYYQWGRHVPIQKTGTVATIDATASEKDNLTNSVQSEKFIIYNTTDSHDWYSPTSTQWDSRWGDQNTNPTAVKSPFDPCPKGWRLGSASGDKSPWDCLDESTTGGSAGGWDFGETGRELGYFATGGYRSNGDGSLGDVGKAGYVWTASPNKALAGALYYDGSEINTWDAFNRANGMNVRCLKEK